VRTVADASETTAASDAPAVASRAPEVGRHGRAAFAFIFVTVALDMLAFGIIAPVLPTLVLQMEGGLFGIAPTGTLFLLAIPVCALGGFAHPSMQALLSRRVAPGEQGRLQGALTSMQGVAMMMGPLVFTQVFAAALQLAGKAGSGAAFVLGGALVLGAIVLSLRATQARRYAR
jgi:MFS family permease